MLFNKLAKAALLSVAAVQTAALAIGSPSNLVIKRGPLLQDIVTWDEVRTLRLAKPNRLTDTVLMLF